MALYFVDDLNNIFTNKVNEYISKGYLINCSTMAGHQGEIAKIHLVSPDHTKLVNILMERRTEKKTYHQTVVISDRIYDVKENHINVNKIDSFSTVWNDNGEEVSSVTYYCIDKYGDSNVFTDKENIEAIVAKQQERFPNHYRGINRVVARMDSDKAKKAVLPFVRRQYKCKSASIKDISYIEKSIDRSGEVHFMIHTKKTWFELS